MPTPVAPEAMPEEIFIVVGNHRSLVGITEIIHTIYGSLAEEFSVKVTRTIEPNRVNIVIDEFSSRSWVASLATIKQMFPATKVVVVATEFITPVSMFGRRLTTALNFFGGAIEWMNLPRSFLPSPLGRKPSYMRRRYLGLVKALAYCDLLAAVHPQILPGLVRLAQRTAPGLPVPLLLYPRIGPLSALQKERIVNLPFGFTMTGTRTSYRQKIADRLVGTFQADGWSGPIYRHAPFQRPAAVAGSDAAAAQAFLEQQYATSAPDYLFNINPPQTANWRHSSPMRLLRAIILGQVPVVTRRFHDHPLEDAALLWDEKRETAGQLVAEVRDRRAWTTKYAKLLETYDRTAAITNAPFVSAVAALADKTHSGGSARRARSKAGNASAN